MHLGYALCYLGQMQQALGREAEATPTLVRARDVFLPLAESQDLPLYDLACIRSLCGDLVGAGRTELTAEEQARRRRYADRAVETLGRCIAGGYHDLAYIEAERDFDSLRKRDDFQMLLAGLRAKAPAPTNSATSALPGTASSRP
jgi:hypothetical protein